MKTGKLVHLECGLTAVQTIFGWTLSGPVPKARSIVSEEISMYLTEENLSQMWNLESLGIRDPIEVQSKQEEESAAKSHFIKTVTQSNDGRYSVKLPWIEDLGGSPMEPESILRPLTNKAAAESRLKSTTHKLNEKGYFQTYDAIFKSWLDEGIVEQVFEYNKENSDCNYFPHHPVFKDSITTPVRPVFDASCKSKGSPSLNDCLYKGPNLMELIPSILIRFRERRIGVSSDVRKAFQMIDVQESDRDYLRFLWWEDASAKKIKIFRHGRVVFGVNCSPFLLAAVIEHHIKKLDETRRDIGQKLLKSLYVDNCVTSVDTPEEYEEFKTASIQIMQEAKMELRQWECSVVESTGAGFNQECGNSHLLRRQEAYAAVVFIRSVDNEDQVTIQLAQAKARVAPVNKPTIPRLELMGCLIATRLTQGAKEALGQPEIQTIYWSDSTTALAWIKRNENWGTFVGNRVRDILKFSKQSEWRHVPGIQNPADLPSRGCSPRELLTSKWWEGPGWLKSSRE
ncbi:uncharacterized protein LOC110862594 [Folsomia candida]|uniref:uncharacterized protein LOC110862594 n=1 Tax=Folsomia candida TaxID=158441 RepID=UPI000B8FEA04|nr:uncharacterized protein LOC110862594 [Folsomia candida]